MHVCEQPVMFSKPPLAVDQCMASQINYTSVDGLTNICGDSLFVGTLKGWLSTL